MSAHAKFSPSGAAKWSECLGALILEEGKTDSSSVYADEGTAAHDVAARCLVEGKSAAEFIGQVIDVCNDDGSVRLKVEVDEAFAEAVQVYVSYVLDVQGKDGVLLTEQKLDISNVLGVPNQFGTGDAIVANFHTKNLWFGDLKFGRGEQVYASYRDVPDGPVKPNHQLALYALGALDLLEITGMEVETVTIAVIQPRLDWIDEYTITVEDLRAFQARMRKAAGTVVALDRETVLSGRNTDGTYVFLKPTEKGCRWCKAKAECPAIAAFVSEQLTTDFDAIDLGRAAAMVPAPQAIATDEMLGRRMAVLDMVKDWASAVKAEGERRVFAGRTINGVDGLPMKIVEGRAGDREWADAGIAESVLLGVLGPQDIYSKPELLGVPAIEKAMGKPAFKAKFVGQEETARKPAVPPMHPGLIKRTPGRPTIALGSDKRPPISAPPADDADFAPIVEDPLCQ